jgi:hypothetical protein
MQSFQNLDLLIHNDSELAETSDILHDSVFLADSWLHDEKNNTFTIHLWREIPEIFKCKNIFLFLSRISYMRASCKLTIHQVTNATIQIKDNIHSYNLFGIYFDHKRNLLLFKTEGAINLEITVGELDCHLIDTGETTWEQFGYSMTWGNKK